MRETVEMIVKALVDDTEAVDVREIPRNGATLIDPVTVAITAFALFFLWTEGQAFSAFVRISATVQPQVIKTKE